MKVVDMAGKEVGEITLSDLVFGAEVNEAVLAREAINKQLENFFNYDGTSNGQKSIGDDD